MLGAWVQKHGLFAVGDRPVELEILDRDGEDSYDGELQVEASMETAADVVVVAAGGAEPVLASFLARMANYRVNWPTVLFHLR